MDTAKLEAWWWHRQGLDGSLSGRTAAQVLEKTGWARSVGGVGPYLTLFSRAGIGRQAADECVAKLEIHELPSARGCTYVLPASDFALGLKAAQSFHGGEEKLAGKLGVTDKELEKLRAGVVKALEKGALDPDDLREALGGLVRYLGEEGKKKGLTTTLPVALGRLQVEGKIRRVPVDGRLDRQRYRYTLWKPDPLAHFQGDVNTELARRYFDWIGPAGRAEFQWFSGLGAKAAKAAMEPLKLVEVEGERWMFPEDRDPFEGFRPAKTPQYALVSSLDGISLLRKDPGWKSHAILDRGASIGSWEYDMETERIVWATRKKKDRALEAAVKQMEEFVHGQMGDARSFSLDSPKSRAPRIAALRKGEL